MVGFQCLRGVMTHNPWATLMTCRASLYTAFGIRGKVEEWLRGKEDYKGMNYVGIELGWYWQSDEIHDELLLQTVLLPLCYHSRKGRALSATLGLWLFVIHAPLSSNLMGETKADDQQVQGRE